MQVVIEQRGHPNWSERYVLHGTWESFFTYTDKLEEATVFESPKAAMDAVARRNGGPGSIGEVLFALVPVSVVEPVVISRAVARLI